MVKENSLGPVISYFKYSYQLEDAKKKTKQQKSRHGHFKDTSGVSQILSLRFSSSETTQISVSAT